VYQSCRRHGQQQQSQQKQQQQLLSPVVVYVPGGAWMFGYKSWGALLARTLLRVGHCTVVMVDYRNFPLATVPEQIQDVESALLWTKRNIRSYGGDPEQIVVVGGSAGGHLLAVLLLQKAILSSSKTTTATPLMNIPTETTESCMTSPTETTVSSSSSISSSSLSSFSSSSLSPLLLSSSSSFEISDCKGFISISVPYDLLSGMTKTYRKHGFDRHGLECIFGGKMSQCDPMQIVLQQQQQLVSIISDDDGSNCWLHRLPPWLICHGTKDATVPYESAQAFYEKLKDRRVPNVEFRTYLGWNHTRGNLEGPMDGDYRFHHHVWEAVRAWTTTTSSATRASTEHGPTNDEGSSKVVVGASIDDAVWDELGRLCPSILVKLGSMFMPV
jgi:acetyl esterase/lipase